MCKFESKKEKNVRRIRWNIYLTAPLSLTAWSDDPKGPGGHAVDGVVRHPVGVADRNAEPPKVGPGGRRQRQNNFIYNELSQKTRFQSVQIAALCLYNIQRENQFFKKISLYNTYNIYSMLYKEE